MSNASKSSKNSVVVTYFERHEDGSGFIFSLTVDGWKFAGVATHKTVSVRPVESRNYSGPGAGARRCALAEWRAKKLLADQDAEWLAKRAALAAAVERGEIV